MEVSKVPKAAQEAFETNGIPAVRDFEKQLRASILRDRERLRALVGGNYRELLSTAEEIIELDQRNRSAESEISDLSRQCKPPQFRETSRPLSTNSSTSAQLRLLTQCLASASIALQARSVLLCAKLTVISRLLLKSIAEQTSPPKSTELLRNKAAAIRRRLLRLIDKQLAHPASAVDLLVQAICAYCLVTSGSSSDAVKHFRHVRLEKLRLQVQSEAKTRLQIKECCRYLISSLDSLKSLLGRSVNDALGALQKQPILQDQTIYQFEAIDVDGLRNLIPQDILAFTPYIKRVLLKTDEVQNVSNEWVKEACVIYTQGVEGVLVSMNSINDVISLRKDLLSMVLPVYFSTHGSEQILESIRQTSGNRIFELCRAQIETLAVTGREMISLVPEPPNKSSLWDNSLDVGSPNSKAAQYARQIRTNHLGIEGGLSRTVKKVKTWAKQISQLHGQFQILESTRWQDLLEEPDDEDEDVARDVASQLSKDDPRKFRNAMEISVQSAINSFNEMFQDAAARFMESDESEQTGHDTARIVYLLRALRESSNILLASLPKIELGTKEVALKLHNALADRVSQQILTTVLNRPALTTKVSPMVDDMPSPQMFRLLRNICKVMADTGGTDIWSPAAVSSLKERLHDGILEGDQSSTYLRSDFDQAFVRIALSNRQEGKPTEPETDVETKAKAYWQRTKLLFGALT